MDTAEFTIVGTIARSGIGKSGGRWAMLVIGTTESMLSLPDSFPEVRAGTRYKITGGITFGNRGMNLNPYKAEPVK